VRGPALPTRGASGPLWSAASPIRPADCPVTGGFVCGLRILARRMAAGDGCRVGVCPSNGPDRRLRTLIPPIPTFRQDIAERHAALLGDYGNAVAKSPSGQTGASHLLRELLQVVCPHRPGQDNFGISLGDGQPAQLVERADLEQSRGSVGVGRRDGRHALLPEIPLKFERCGRGQIPSPRVGWRTISTRRAEDWERGLNGLKDWCGRPEPPPGFRRLSCRKPNDRATAVARRSCCVVDQWATRRVWRHSRRARKVIRPRSPARLRDRGDRGPRCRC
jgi:hypothetical protein